MCMHVSYSKGGQAVCPTQGLRSGPPFARAGTNMRTDNKQRHYIQWRCSYECHTKQQTTRALWGNNF
jgi:hypothetical protein